jgi:hypothetical protein
VILVSGRLTTILTVDLLVDPGLGPPVRERRLRVAAMTMGGGLLGVALLALGVWLVLAWVDAAAGYDSTCENALRYWTDDNRHRSCQAQMGLRVVTSVAFVSLGGCYIALAMFAKRVKRPARLHSPQVVAVMLLVLTVASIWNEITRSGGLLENQG